MTRASTIAVITAVAAAFGVGGYFLGSHGSHVAAPDAKGTDAGRKVLYWHDPMYPQQKFDKPGRSPFMNMDLVPVYADEKSNESGVTVNPGVRQSLGVRTAVAQTTDLRQAVSAVGYVQADERRIARAEVRTQGWIERLHVRAVNDAVRAGQVLAEVYAPELLAAQEEYLLVRRMADEPLARAARRRLSLLGVPENEIAKLERTGTASRRVPILAPVSGVLTELGAREGAMVQAGMAAFTITDLSSVWLVLEAPEAHGSVLRQGQKAEARVQMLPGRTFEGRVDYVYPELNAQTRTVKARVTLANPELALKPGMFAQVTLESAARRALTVPAEAVIQTGTRSVVIVAEGERFRPATVKTGVESAEHIEIVSGLREGERVVASGQFLIDSEASLRGVLARLQDGEKELHRGTGKVTGVEADKGRVEIDHEPMPSLKWPRMTMEFVSEDKAALAKLKKGDAVEFELKGEPNPAGDHVLLGIRKKP